MIQDKNERILFLLNKGVITLYYRLIVLLYIQHTIAISY